MTAGWLALKDEKKAAPVPAGYHEQIRKQVEKMTDIDTLLEGASNLEGLIAKYRKIGGDVDELGKAQAWVRLQIGVALGPPPRKGPGRGNKRSHACDLLSSQDVLRHRKIAHPKKHRHKTEELIRKGKWSFRQMLKAVKELESEPPPPEDEPPDPDDPSVVHGDCLEVMKRMDDNSVDLVFGSPPYESARDYGIEYDLTGDDWVDWMFARTVEALRVSSGLVAFVMEGTTTKYKWSAVPALLMANLHRAGYDLRKPVIYRRLGTPGAGGPDWLRNDYEFVLCVTNGGKLPWSDNTAMGTEPKWGNEGSHNVRKKDGSFEVGKGYQAPEKVNPGNVIDCLAGGGHMGSNLCHENEAPFPEKLAEFFIRSFCKEGGTVLDPFSGSGTTIAVAHRFGRNAIGIDVRESQVELSKRRVRREEKPLLTRA